MRAVCLCGVGVSGEVGPARVVAGGSVPLWEVGGLEVCKVEVVGGVEVVWCVVHETINWVRRWGRHVGRNGDGGSAWVVVPVLWRIGIVRKGLKGSLSSTVLVGWLFWLMVLVLACTIQPNPSWRVVRCWLVCEIG